MDENKDILTSEIEVENNENSDTDTVTEILEQDNFEVENLDSDFTETDDAETNLSDNSKKKNRVIQLPIIIAFVLVAVSAVCLFVFKGFFDKSVVGTWAETAVSSEATGDEAQKIEQYYTFESDGKMSLQTGTMTWVGEYTVTTSEEGKSQLNITMNQSQNIFDFDVSGNIFTGRTLTLTNTYNDYSVKLGATSVKTPELKVDKDFKANDKLCGTWTYDQGLSKMSYTFNNDGTVLVNQADMLFVEGVYTYTDKLIEIKYYYDSEETMDISYTVEDNALNLNDIKFEKDNGEKSEKSE